MKKVFICLIILFLGLTLNAKEDLSYKNYFRSDSGLVYIMDEVTNSWVLSSREEYFYGVKGRLDSIIWKSIKSGTNLNKTEYLYNEEGLLSIETYYSWNEKWIHSSRNLISYDDNHNYSEIVVQTYGTNNWVNLVLQKYTKYNITGSLAEFQMFEWNYTDWVYHLTDYWFYNERGQLIKRLAFLTDSIPYYQILYKYDKNGLRTKMYAQFASGNSWNNSWLQDFQYNECGIQTVEIDYYGSGTDWFPENKTVTSTSFDLKTFPDKKIPVCHNGHTIYISKNSLKAHLGHGDCIGECASEKDSDKQECTDKEKPKKPPFTVYPNPAKEKITIKFDKDECTESKKVELTDFYGKILRSYNIKDNNDLTIYKISLHSGKYYIRVTGKEVFSTVVIIE